MSRNLLTILPGKSRDLDRALLNEDIALRIYNPAKDKNLTHEEAKDRTPSIRVSVLGAPEQEFRFVMPCYFWGECGSIDDLAAELGEKIHVGEPVVAEDEIGRSLLRSWLALGDGSIYTWVKPSGYAATYANKWLIQLDPAQISRLKDIQMANEDKTRREREA